MPSHRPPVDPLEVRAVRRRSQLETALFRLFLILVVGAVFVVLLVQTSPAAVDRHRHAVPEFTVADLLAERFAAGGWIVGVRRTGFGGELVRAVHHDRTGRTTLVVGTGWPGERLRRTFVDGRLATAYTLGTPPRP